MPCLACGGADFELHLRVEGEAGPEGLVPTTDRFGVALSDIVRCRNCGHMQLARMPRQVELSEAYGKAASVAYIEEEAGQRETARRTLAVIEQHAARGSLLDLGCWVGFFLDEARSRGWQTVGVEPSIFAADFARRRLDLDVHNTGLFEADLADGAFEAAFMGDVIEHIPSADEALRRVAALLASHGILALTLPDAGSRVARVLRRRWWSVIPTHVHYFTRHSMRLTLERTGFEVLKVHTAPKAFTARYYFGRVGGYRASAGRLLVGAAERTRLADRLVTPNFRDRMLVIARRA